MRISDITQELFDGIVELSGQTDYEPDEILGLVIRDVRKQIEALPPRPQEAINREICRRIHNSEHARRICGGC